MSETSLKRNCDTCVFCEFWDVFKITFLIEHLQTTTSDNTTKHDTTQIKGQRKKFNCKIGYRTYITFGQKKLINYPKGKLRKLN